MRSKTWLFIIVMTLFISACTSKEEKIRREINLGIKANYASHFKIAIEHFENVIKWDETNAEAHLNMGRSYMGLKKYKDAMRIYTKTIELNPNYGEAYRSRAQLHFFLGDRDASCQDYLKAEELGVENLHNFTKHCKKK